jgi:hypothetical protein
MVEMMREAAGVTVDHPFTRLCQERDPSRLYGGRLCWGRVLYRCARCGKGICAVHARLVVEATICVSCAATPR